MRRTPWFVVLPVAIALAVAGSAGGNPVKGQAFGAGTASFVVRYDQPPAPGRAVSWRMPYFSIGGVFSANGRVTEGGLRIAGITGGSASKTSFPETGVVDPFVLQYNGGGILIPNLLCEGGPYCGPGIGIALPWRVNMSCGKGTYEKLIAMWTMELPCQLTLTRFYSGAQFKAAGKLTVIAALTQKITGMTALGAFLLTP